MTRDTRRTQQPKTTLAAVSRAADGDVPARATPHEARFSDPRAWLPNTTIPDHQHLRSAVNHCLELIDDADHDSVGKTLLPLLIDVHPAAAPVDNALMDAAGMFVEYPPAEADDFTVLGLAEYAHRAALVLFGPDHPRSLLSTTLLADALHQHAQHTASLAVRNTAIAGHHRRKDPYGVAVQRFAFADTLHDAGQCRQAIQYAERALHDWLPHTDDEPMAAPVLVARLVRLLDLCARRNDARATIYDKRALLPQPGTSNAMTSAN